MQNKIAAIRKKRHIKQKELAALLGMKVGTLGTWERGRYPFSFEDACRIADILECTLDELAGREVPAKGFSDPRQAAINRDYEVLDERGKDLAAASLNGMAEACIRGEDESQGAKAS